MPIEAPVLRTADDLMAALLQASWGSGVIAGFSVERSGTGPSPE